MSELLGEMPFSHLNTAEFYDITNDRFDSIFTNSELKDYISKVDVVHDINKLNFNYFTELEFNSRFTSVVKNGYISISIFHANIRSLNSNHRKLCQFLESICVDFDIIILTEIWSSNISFYHNILPGYIFYYVLPPKGNVGGVGIFVNKAIESSENLNYKLNLSDSACVENIWLDIKKR